MTEIEQAQIATNFLNAISPVLIAVFLLGLLVGVFFFGRVVESIDRLGHRFRRQRRIKFATGATFEYLYLFKGRYYKHSEYQQVLKDNSMSFITYKAYKNYLKQQQAANKEF
jgi:hypothetical protein